MPAPITILVPRLQVAMDWELQTFSWWYNRLYIKSAWWQETHWFHFSLATLSCFSPCRPHPAFRSTVEAGSPWGLGTRLCELGTKLSISYYMSTSATCQVLARMVISGRVITNLLHDNGMRFPRQRNAFSWIRWRQTVLSMRNQLKFQRSLNVKWVNFFSGLDTDIGILRLWSYRASCNNTNCQLACMYVLNYL